MRHTVASDLEFDKIIQLVAAQAGSGLGRRLLIEADVLPPIGDSVRLADLTVAVERLVDGGGRLSFAGIDDALPWLAADASAPTEPAELLILLTLARRIGSIRRRIIDGTEDQRALGQLGRRLPDTSALIEFVAPKLSRDGTIADDASPQLLRLRRQATRVRKELVGRLEEIRRSHPGVTTDAPATVRRDRYCLPVHSAARGQLAGLLLDSSATGATAFIEPFAVVDLNNDLAETAAREREEIGRIVAEIATAFADSRDDLADAVDTMATLDAAQARALFGAIVDGRVIVPRPDDELVLRGARHPLLDERLHSLRQEVFGDAEQRDPSRRAVPLDFALPSGVRTLVISGPNAGGKTVVLKTVGLMALMAAHGIPLPAAQGTSIPAVTHIWCHIGDEQNVAADLSSFSGAMAATVDLLRSGGSGSLVIYDEIGAGTDPLEGAALGLALLEDLTRRGCLTVATTHLASIALNANGIDGMDNAAMGYDEGRDLPTYSLAMGRPGRSRALEIASRTGIPQPILDRASELLGGHHLELDHWLGRLEEVESELEAQRRQLEEQRRAVVELHDEARREMEGLREDRRRVVAERTEERDRLRRKAKDRLDEALQKLDQAIEEQDRVGRRRRQKLREQAMDFGDPSDQSPASPPPTISQGARVRLAGLGGGGTLEEVRGERALVAAQGKRLWVDLGDLEVVHTPEPGPRRPTLSVVAADGPGRELVLLGMDGEQAREEVERFLDRAFTAGGATVRIVHGHGTGVLRRVVAEVCRSHPAVRSFRHAPRNRGGTGATEVELHESD